MMLSGLALISAEATGFSPEPSDYAMSESPQEGPFPPRGLSGREEATDGLTLGCFTASQPALFIISLFSVQCIFPRRIMRS